MLDKSHIDFYWEQILQAKQRALSDILTARAFAEEASCKGCPYCDYLVRHEQILGKTACELATLVDSLAPGARAQAIFPKKYNRGELFYCGLITSDGVYTGAPGETYQEAHTQYTNECGVAEAHKAIYILEKNGRAEVIFCDRQAPPSDAQKETLRNLLIDAEGKVRFFFVYDPSHPH